MYLILIPIFFDTLRTGIGVIMTGKVQLFRYFKEWKMGVALIYYNANSKMIKMKIRIFISEK